MPRSKSPRSATFHVPDVCISLQAGVYNILVSCKYKIIRAKTAQGPGTFRWRDILMRPLWSPWAEELWIMSMCVWRDVSTWSAPRSLDLPYLRGKGLVKKARYYFILIIFYKYIKNVWNVKKSDFHKKVFCQLYNVGIA